MAQADHRTRRLTVLAQDPGLRSGGKVLTTRLEVPAERLEPGPKGHRLHVIDYDASTDTLYKPRATDLEEDPYRDVDDPEQLLGDPHFHAQNAYAIVMSLLALFEAALGRHLQWAFDSGGHHLKIAPHAFADANAFYSRRDEGLLFGYFPGRSGRTVFTCLSHDIVAHETTHALLDGLRVDYMRPSSSDQAAFHEGFSDVVGLLSVLRQEAILRHVLGLAAPGGETILSILLKPEVLRNSMLMGLAEEMGKEMEGDVAALHGDALRRSVRLEASADLLQQPAFEPAHRRGEILVAAVMNAFLEVWVRRLDALGGVTPGGAGRGGDAVRVLDLERVVEEGAAAAEHLVTIAIRALDYTPPVDLDFGDYLSAVLTADQQLIPDDKYDYRGVLRRSFASYGILPSSCPGGEGYWCPPEKEVSYRRSHFAELQRDPDEVFRFLWENREPLELDRDAFTRVRSVRPVRRVGPDGFIQHETVAGYLQTLVVRATDLGRLDIRRPDGMPDAMEIHLYGGGTLIFDEFGRLKFHVGSGVRSRRQSERLDSLWRSGAFDPTWGQERRFERLHRDRGLPDAHDLGERW